MNGAPEKGQSRYHLVVGILFCKRTELHAVGIFEIVVTWALELNSERGPSGWRSFQGFKGDLGDNVQEISGRHQTTSAVQETRCTRGINWNQKHDQGEGRVSCILRANCAWRSDPSDHRRINVWEILRNGRGNIFLRLDKRGKGRELKWSKRWGQSRSCSWTVVDLSSEWRWLYGQ